jgi:thiamine pyrophosphokinase
VAKTKSKPRSLTQSKKAPAAKAKAKPKPKAGTSATRLRAAPSQYTLRAFLIGASPAQDLEHTRATLLRLQADPALDLFIGVDGGTRTWLALGHKPHMAVGDWDSFTGAEAREKLTTLHHLTLPVDKDRSDLFFAASVALNAEATQLHCLGVTAGRPDHHLATVMDLANLASGESGVKLDQVSAYSPEGDYHFLSPLIPRWRESCPSPPPGAGFGGGGQGRGLSLKGFKYPLKNGELRPSSHGLSNRTWSPFCEVILKEGALAVVIPAEKTVLHSGRR